ncbi:MAG: GumC family protein [Bacteroidia bacterium]
MNTKKNNALIDTSDLKLVWRIVSRNWYIPIIFVVVAYLIGYFYTYKLTNIYAISTQLQIKSNDVYYQQNVISEVGRGNSYQTYIDNSTQMKVIQSYDLVKSAVDKLKSKLQISYYIVGRVRTTEQFSGMPFDVNVKYLNPRLYLKRINFRILDWNNYEISYKAGDAEIVKTGKFNEDNIDLDFNIQITRSILNRSMVKDQQSMQFQFEIKPIESLIATFQNSLTVENPDYTNILRVTFRDILPERAKLFLDTLSAIYIKNTLSSRYELNERTLEFIDKQMVQVSSELKDIEDTMQDYKSERHILDLDKEQQDYFSKLSTYDAQKSQLNLQIQALDDLEKYIIEDRDPQFLPPSVYLNRNDEFLVKEASQLYQLQILHNQKSNVATEKNFNIIEIENTIKKTKQNLLLYINNSRKATKKIIENINSEIANYVVNIKTIPKKQRELLEIQRKVDVNQDLYTFLLQKRANTFIAKATIIPETKVIESPRVSSVVWPDRNKIKYTFSFVGLIIAVILVTVRVIFFTTIQTMEELKEVTRFPVLGELPQVKNMLPAGIIVDIDSRSKVAESFRTLRTNLQYLNTHKGSKTILITSNGPGEGKTFCSINLAAILAKAGKKTLILELDLHKPRVQKALEMEADIGISTVVIGNTTMKESIKSTNIENLFVMLSGPIPPNPSEMVLSNELKAIFDYGKEHFDYVIVDTPPAGLISDSIYLMQYADISLFVLNTKFTNKRIITAINELVENNKIQSFAYILNGVKRSRSRYYYNRYSYGYGYGGYGYGYGSYGGSYGEGYKRNS